MQIHQINDTSTQAMTEVALGLSMAFFALLILALMSFQLPSLKTDDNTELSGADKVKVEHNSTLASTSESDKQYLLYFREQFYDLQLLPVVIGEIPEEQDLIVAVESSTSFANVMSLRQKINRTNLSITVITQEWLGLLEQKR